VISLLISAKLTFKICNICNEELFSSVFNKETVDALRCVKLSSWENIIEDIDSI
jgi:hypothetical protein